MSNPLAQLSLLLNLKIRKWAGEVSDKKALGAVAKAFGGDTHRDKYRKSLFVTNPLEAIDKCAGRIRLNFYKWTLAWLDSGNGRLVSSMDYRDFAVEHRGLVNEFEKEVDQFILDYPDHQAVAKERKGDLYNEHEYPPQSELRDRFAIELTTLPFPDNADFRVSAPESIIDELNRSVDESIDAVVHNVEADIRGRVSERVGMLRDGLASGKRWAKTLFEELDFVVGMGLHMQEILPKKLGKDLAFIQEHITSADPAKLRHSEEGKATCLKACESVLKSLIVT